MLCVKNILICLINVPAFTINLFPSLHFLTLPDPVYRGLFSARRSSLDGSRDTQCPPRCCHHCMFIFIADYYQLSGMNLLEHHFSSLFSLI